MQLLAKLALTLSIFVSVNLVAMEQKLGEVNPVKVVVCGLKQSGKSRLFGALTGETSKEIRKRDHDGVKVHQRNIELLFEWDRDPQFHAYIWTSEEVKGWLLGQNPVFEV